MEKLNRRWRHSKETKKCLTQTLIGEIRGEDVSEILEVRDSSAPLKKNHCVEPRAFAELCERGTILLNEIMSLNAERER